MCGMKYLLDKVLRHESWQISCYERSRLSMGRIPLNTISKLKHHSLNGHLHSWASNIFVAPKAWERFLKFLSMSMNAVYILHELQLLMERILILIFVFLLVTFAYALFFFVSNCKHKIEGKKTFFVSSRNKMIDVGMWVCIIDCCKTILYTFFL